jgi:hypothetical protein
MLERTRYAPPKSNVGTASASSWQSAHRFAIWVFALLVLADVAFHVDYSSLLLHLSRRGEVTLLQIAGFAGATTLLVAGTIALLARRKSKSLLWLSLVFGVTSIFPAIWYNMVASAALSATGLLLSYLQAPSEAKPTQE